MEREEEEKLYVLSIAGFDPSGGAGILADIKTFEANKVHGLAVVTAITYQNDKEFDDLRWISKDEIVRQLEILLKRFSVNWVKIGLIENLEVLQHIVSYLKEKNPDVKIIWDPILKATAGFNFHDSFEKDQLLEVCKEIYLITPNLAEIKKLVPDSEETEGADSFSSYCNVLLKGGHSNEKFARDILFEKNEKSVFEGAKLDKDKHGTGCVLSSAILTNLAKGYDLKEACKEGKEYVTDFINSNNSLLGFHYV